MGAWEVQKGEVPQSFFDETAESATDDSDGGNHTDGELPDGELPDGELPLLMRHVVPVWPACWDPSNCIGPSVYFGPEELSVPDDKGLTILFDIKLEDHGNFTFKPECGWGPGDDCNSGVTLNTNGKWVVFDKHGSKGLDFPVGQWRRVTLELGPGEAWAALAVGNSSTNGEILANTTTFDRFGDFSLKLLLSRYIFADIDNFRIFVSN
jgi:hypothetical protein